MLLLFDKNSCIVRADEKQGKEQGCSRVIGMPFFLLKRKGKDVKYE